MKDDLRALEELFIEDKPYNRKVQSRHVIEVIYGFGNASGAGFGSSFKVKGKVKYRLGRWGKDMNSSLSDYRELSNLVESLEDLNKDGILEGCEVYILTDNSVAESAFYKGSSENRTLFELVLG